MRERRLGLSRIPEDVRAAVFQREAGRCAVCFAAEATDFHHRVRRRDGGHSVANGIAVCRLCHGRIHSRPTWARKHGWIVSAWGDVTSAPVRIHGALVVLDDAGGATPSAA